MSALPPLPPSEPPSSAAGAGYRNIRLTLAYDGGTFCGWQVQLNQPTIQAELERAIHELTGEKVSVYSAGRTDSGVHALGQVANFHTRSPIPAPQIARALQTHLPPQIVLLDSSEVHPAFHATFWARTKRYRYVIDNSPISLPFLSGYAWSIRRRLDEQAMHEAAKVLLGKHDFRSFETDWPNKVSSVRTVLELKVFRAAPWALFQSASAAPTDSMTAGAAPERITSAEPTFVCLEIVADGFLYNMVRAITGTLVNVGRGKWTAEDVSQILQSQRRSNAGTTAPACGLYLVSVTYDDFAGKPR